MRKLILAVSFLTSAALFAPSQVSAQTSLDVIAAFTNQRGSTLYIENVDQNGHISGYFVNRAAGFQCQGTPYPVVGWVLAHAISFTVQWENQTQNCNSITAWAGYVSTDGNTITTNWALAVSGSTTILQGQDTFTRTAQRQAPSLVPPGTRP